MVSVAPPSVRVLVCGGAWGPGGWILSVCGTTVRTHLKEDPRVNLSGMYNRLKEAYVRVGCQCACLQEGELEKAGRTLGDSAVLVQKSHRRRCQRRPCLGPPSQMVYQHHACGSLWDVGQTCLSSNVLHSAAAVQRLRQFLQNTLDSERARNY